LHLRCIADYPDARVLRAQVLTGDALQIFHLGREHFAAEGEALFARAAEQVVVERLFGLAGGGGGAVHGADHAEDGFFDLAPLVVLFGDRFYGAIEIVERGGEARVAGGEEAGGSGGGPPGGASGGGATGV